VLERAINIAEERVPITFQKEKQKRKILSEDEKKRLLQDRWSIATGLPDDSVTVSAARTA